MSAGFTANMSLAQFNAVIGQNIINVRNDLQNASYINASITANGGASFLESLGMGANDAAAVVAAYGNLQAIVNAYQGTGTIPNEFNYMANTETLWGGQ